MLGSSVKFIPDTLKWFSKKCLALYMLPWEFGENFKSMDRLWSQVPLPLSFHFSIILPVLIHILPAWYYASFNTSTCFLGLSETSSATTRSCLVFSPLWCLPLLCRHKHFSATQWARLGNWSFWKFNLTKNGDKFTADKFSQQISSFP